MALEARDKKVYDLLNDAMYIVPENQRKYIWVDNNWSELLEDIDLVYKEKVKDHFIGSIVLKEEIENDGIRRHFSIIDGQQRISTLTMLLVAVAMIYAENRDAARFEGLEKALFVKDRTNQSHPIVSYKANKNIAKVIEVMYYNVRLRLSSNMPMISLSEILTESKTPKNIETCITFFYDELKKRVNSDMNRLENYRNIIDDIRYIDIVAKEDEDAFTIFEILNARGQSLSDFELLRNFLLKYSDKDKKESTLDAIKQIDELLQDSVEIFLKHYAMHRYGEKTNKDLNRPYKIIVRKEKANNKNQFLVDLLQKALYYNKILTAIDCNDLEKKVFRYFKSRNQQQFRPIILGLMHQRDIGVLSELDYERYLEYIYEYFVCFHVIGEQTSNKIEDIIEGYAYKIENDFSYVLLEKLKKSMTARLPTKENFCNSIKRICYSNYWKAFSGRIKRENVHAICEVVEQELGYIGNFDECNIEHCLPDCESQNNAIIGNLFLLESTLNDCCQNKSLSEKIPFYKQSRFKLPAIIVDAYEKGEDFNKENRTQWFAEILYDYITKIVK